MDYNYDGELGDVYCVSCKEKMHYKEGWKHKCFINVGFNNITCVGNVIVLPDDYEQVEYLEDDEDVLQSLRSRMIRTSNFENKSSPTIQQIETGHFASPRDKEADAPKKMWTIENKKVTLEPSTLKKSPLTPKKPQPLASVENLETPNSQIDYEIELNAEGFAEGTEKNLITLLTLVKENECIWNILLPLEKRNSHLTSTAWFNIAKQFKGWDPKMAKEFYNSLKTKFINRNAKPRSGSAARKKKPWVYEEYLSFLKGIVTPASTISNIPFPENPEESSTENASALGFEKKQSTESPVSSKRKKSLDPLEEALIENLNNRISQRESSKRHSEGEQWGLWLGRRIDNFPSANRLEIQAEITHYIHDKEKEIMSNNKGQ